jgi:GNAT superfamily N-acetyltransferase
MNTVQILAATRADVPRLLPLVAEYWRYEAIPGFEATRITQLLTRVCDDPRLGRVWIATVDGADAGYLLAVFVFSLEFQGMSAEIDEFCVMPAHRGAGVGAQLLAAAEQDFRAAGCTNVSLQIGRANEAARKFYRGRGFEDRAGYELVSKML